MAKRPYQFRRLQEWLLINFSQKEDFFHFGLFVASESWGSPVALEVWEVFNIVAWQTNRVAAHRRSALL